MEWSVDIKETPVKTFVARFSYSLTRSLHKVSYQDPRLLRDSDESGLGIRYSELELLLSPIPNLQQTS